MKKLTHIPERYKYPNENSVIMLPNANAASVADNAKTILRIKNGRLLYLSGFLRFEALRVLSVFHILFHLTVFSLTISSISVMPNEYRNPAS